MRPRSTKLCCGSRAIAGGIIAVRKAIQGNCRHGDNGKAREPPLDLLIQRISWGKTQTMSVGVDDNFDVVRVVKCQCSAFKGRFIKSPGWRVAAPNLFGDAPPILGQSSATPFRLE